MGFSARTAILGAALLVAGCAFDWDGLDPRASGTTGATGGAGATGGGGPGGSPGAGGDATTTTSSTGGGGGMGGAGAGGMAPGGNGPLFFDDFERPDGATLGNGWLEKTPDAFALLGGRAHAVDLSANYLSNLVYRPDGEQVADVALTAELHVSGSGSASAAQIFARAQGAGVPNSYDAYLIWLPTPTVAALTRQEGTTFGVELTSFPLSAPVDASAVHRMRLRISGSGPVQVQGAIDRFEGGTWQNLGGAAFTDTSPDAIVGPGTFGFTGGASGATYAFDNFQAEAL